MLCIMDDLWKLNTLVKVGDFISQESGRSVFALRNYVNGSYQDHSLEQDFLPSYNPKTGRILAKIPISNANGVQAAVNAAKAAFPSWSKSTRKTRSHYLQRIASLLEENRELFAVWESIDQGKTIERARVEVDRAISNFQYVGVNNFRSPPEGYNTDSQTDTSPRISCMKRAKYA